MRRAKEIRELEIDEISLVDRGANQHAKTVIAKRHEEKDTMEQYFDEDGNPIDITSLDLGDVVYDEDGDAYEFTDEVDDDDDDYDDEYDDEDADDRELELVGKAWNFKPSPRAYAAGERVGRKLNPAVNAGRRGRAKAAQGGRRAYGAAYGVTNRAIGGTINAAGTRGFQVGAAGIGGAGLGAGGVAGGMAVQEGRKNRVRKSFADEVRVELSKALTDADRDEVISKALGQIEVYAEIAQSAEIAAESERQLRLEREYTEIAKGYNVPVHPEDLGRVLMHLAEVLPIEEQQIIAKCLDAASAELFEEYGNRGGGDNVDILSQVDQLVDSRVSKSGIGREEAFASVFEANPDAYDEYLAERQGR